MKAIKKRLPAIMPALALGIFIFVSACTSSGVPNLEGVLQSTDPAGGTITIYGTDNVTHVVQVDSGTQVVLNGEDITLASLVPGTFLEIQDTIIASIVQYQEGALTVYSEDVPGQIMLYVDSYTRVYLADGSPGTITDLPPGTEVTVSYDPVTQDVLTVSVYTGPSIGGQ